MSYKNIENKRAWERSHREDRNRRKREVRALEALVLEQVAQPHASKRDKSELLKQARKEGLYSRRNLALRIDVGKVSVKVPGDAIGRAVARAVRWWTSK